LYNIPEDTSYHRIDYLKNKTKVSLGGRVAEEIILEKDKISTGEHGIFLNLLILH
jgi:cell division protease FtsH